MTAGTRMKEDSGYVLILFSLMLVALLAFAGMGVDLGAWYSRGYQLQRGADAAALAGVAWMPDFTAAKASALEAAKKNGFVPSSTIDIKVVAVSSHRLKVTITDSDIPTYFTKPILNIPRMARSGTAEYELPLPLGSPKNTFGTGNELQGANAEGIWARIAGYCNAKEQGDRYASKFDGNANAYSTYYYACDSPRTFNDCVPVPPPGGDAPCTNPEYDQKSFYTYAIDVPPGLTHPVDVLIYDGPFFNSPEPPGSPDLVNYTLTSHMNTTFRLFAPDATPFDDKDNVEMTTAAGNSPCMQPGGLAQTLPRTFGTNETNAFNKTIVNTTNPSRWTSLCTIPASAPGRYLLRVGNEAGEPNSDVSNSYGIALGDGSNVLPSCSGDPSAPQYSPTCPRVYGQLALGVYANDQASMPDASGLREADFYLADVDSGYAGKRMVIDLWDPGEGAYKIQLLDPNGDPVAFKWRTANPCEDNCTTPEFDASLTLALDVSGHRASPGPTNSRVQTSAPNQFNDRLVRMYTQLPKDYTTRYGDKTWWKIKYFTKAAKVTDATTWGASVLGNPIHIVE